MQHRSRSLFSLVLLLSVIGAPAAKAVCTTASFSSAVLGGVPASSSPDAIVYADFTGDGVGDIVWADRLANTVTMHEGIVPEPNGGFYTPVVLSAGTLNAPVALAAGDFNGDGINDLVVVNTTYLTVTMFPATGATVHYVNSVGSQLNGVAVGDFNRDGRLDLAVVDAGGGAPAVKVYTGNGAGTFTSGWGDLTGGMPFDIAAADMNHDGKLDLVVSNSTSKTVTVYSGDGTGNFTALTSRTLTGAPRRLVVGDFHLDGSLDVAVSTGTGDLALLTGAGRGASYVLNAPVYYPGGVGTDWGITAGDYNNDGRLDVATTGFTGGGVSVFLGQADGTLGSATAVSGGTSPVAITTMMPQTRYRQSLAFADQAGHRIGWLGNNCQSRGADANGDGSVTSTDIFYLVNYLFTGGPPPVE